MKKRILIFFTTLLTSLNFAPINVVNAAEDNANIDSSLKINQSVDDDLKGFNFDYKKYLVDSSQYYQPIMLNFAESLDSNYYDLIYLYLNNDSFTKVLNFKVDIYVGNNSNKLKLYKEDVIYEPLKAGQSEDGVVRYAVSGYDDYRITYKYRKYHFKTIKTSVLLPPLISGGIKNLENEYELNNIYQFQYKNPILQFSNNINVVLEDAHCWSWHFDEDNGWDNFWEWFGGNKNDTLKDQLFYSFYVKDWNVKELKSIKLQYKKVFFDGYRAWRNDNDGISKLFTDILDFSDIAGNFEAYNNFVTKVPYAKYMLNSYNAYNSAPKYYDFDDRGILLGNSLKDISQKVDYTVDIIVPEEKTSEGVGHKYTWNTIMNINEFKKCFGQDSDIYDFAKNYFNEDEKYWIINFDDYYYSYTQYYRESFSTHCARFVSLCPKHNDGLYYLCDSNHSDCKLHFLNYNRPDLDVDNRFLPLEQFIIKNFYQDSDTQFSFEWYSCQQEYIFDMRALEMTFEDVAGVEYTLPTSVASVKEEASGGGSEFFLPSPPDLCKDLLRILLLIILTVILIAIFPILSPIIGIVISFVASSLKIVISMIKKIFKQRKKKNERKDE